MYARCRRVARYGFSGMSRALVLIASVFVLAGCAGLPVALPVHPADEPACEAGSVEPVGTVRVAYAASASNGAVAYRTPSGDVLARFGPTNVNDFPTVFEALAKRVDASARRRGTASSCRSSRTGSRVGCPRAT